MGFTDNVNFLKSPTGNTRSTSMNEKTRLQCHPPSQSARVRIVRGHPAFLRQKIRWLGVPYRTVHHVRWIARCRREKSKAYLELEQALCESERFGTSWPTSTEAFADGRNFVIMIGSHISRFKASFLSFTVNYFYWYNLPHLYALPLQRRVHGRCICCSKGSNEIPCAWTNHCQVTQWA